MRIMPLFITAISRRELPLIRRKNIMLLLQFMRTDKKSIFALTNFSNDQKWINIDKI